MTAPYLRPRTILDNFSRLDPDAWNPVDVFRARRKELRESARIRFLRPHVRRAHWHSLWVGKRDQPDARSVTRTATSWFTCRAKGTATLRLNKVAVLHAWSREGWSLGCCLSTGQTIDHIVASTVS